MTVKVGDIIGAIEQVAPRALQESWDNSGLIVGSAEAECSGVMLCLDVTADVVAQARAAGCNLIVSHHPLIFKGVKQINDLTVQGAAIIDAIRSGIAVYSAHTSLDNAPQPWGVSYVPAQKFGATVLRAMTDTGTGVLAELPEPLPAAGFIDECRTVFEADGLRHSRLPQSPIAKVVFGGGACGFLIPDAIAAGADAIVTSDVRYHDFLDYGQQILIVDLTHFDTEKCTKEIFKRIISQKIPKFAPVFCANETNPIEYK